MIIIIIIISIIIIFDIMINDAIPPTVGSTLQKSSIPPTVPWPN